MAIAALANAELDWAWALDLRALHFFYGITLGQKEAFERTVNGREPEKLPPVLSPEDISRFLEAIAGLRDLVQQRGAHANREIVDAWDLRCVERAERAHDCAGSHCRSAMAR